MSETVLKIKSGFCPYGDGSGFQVEVVIQQRADDAEPMLSMNTTHLVEARKWPEIKAGLERLLLALPTPPAPGRE